MAVSQITTSQLMHGHSGILGAGIKMETRTLARLYFYWSVTTAWASHSHRKTFFLSFLVRPAVTNVFFNRVYISDLRTKPKWRAGLWMQLMVFWNISIFCRLWGWLRALFLFLCLIILVFFCSFWRQRARSYSLSMLLPSRQKDSVLLPMQRN